MLNPQVFQFRDLVAARLREARHVAKARLVKPVTRSTGHPGRVR